MGDGFADEDGDRAANDGDVRPAYVTTTISPSPTRVQHNARPPDSH
jgi:hypothetical protein